MEKAFFYRKITEENFFLRKKLQRTFSLCTILEGIEKSVNKKRSEKSFSFQKNDLGKRLKKNFLKKSS